PRDVAERDDAGLARLASAGGPIKRVAGREGGAQRRSQIDAAAGARRLPAPAGPRGQLARDARSDALDLRPLVGGTGAEVLLRQRGAITRGADLLRLPRLRLFVPGGEGGRRLRRRIRLAMLAQRPFLLRE